MHFAFYSTYRASVGRSKNFIIGQVEDSSKWRKRSIYAIHLRILWLSLTAIVIGAAGAYASEITPRE
jgi:hypothetical protein